MSEKIVFERSCGVAIVRFNKPEIRNPLSVNILRELHEFVDEIKNDAEVSGVVLTGTANVFASGADLKEIAEITNRNAGEFAEYGQSLMSKIEKLSQPVIAAVNGYCFGGALDLALACDTRIASPTASFAHPGASLGIITGWSGTQRLPRLIGQARALEIFFTAKSINAIEALQIGLIDQIHNDPLAVALAKVNERA